MSPVARPEEGVVLSPRTVLDGKVTLLVPNDFQPMSKEALLRKYPRPNPPTVVYANEGASVSIGMDHTVHRVPMKDLPEAMRQMKAGLDQNFPGGTTWFRSEMTQINGRPFCVMDVRVVSGAEEIRNVLAGTSLDDRLLMFTVNMPKPLEPQWLETANKIIQSIKLN